jgi:hypothetical protein
MRTRILNCQTPEARKEYRNALNFWAEKLIGGQTSKDITVTVRFVDGLKRKDKMLADIGHKGKRCFDIRIEKKLTHKKTMMALAHEFTHLKQYANGELKEKKKNGKWITNWINESYVEDDIQYYDRPWEIEAFGREQGLYFQWLRFKKSMNQYGKLL